MPVNVINQESILGAVRPIVAAAEERVWVTALELALTSEPELELELEQEQQENLRCTAVLEVQRVVQLVQELMPIWAST